jgi:hypothetical protein
MCADHGQRYDQNPADADGEHDVARLPPQPWAEREANCYHRRADCSDAAGRKGEFAIIGALDQRLGDVLADEKCRNGEYRIEKETPSGLLEPTDDEGDDQGGDNSGGGEEFGEIGPDSDRRALAQPIESGVFEPIWAGAARDRQGQSHCCKQARQCHDCEPGIRHREKLRPWSMRVGPPQWRLELPSSRAVSAFTAGNVKCRASNCVQQPGRDCPCNEQLKSGEMATTFLQGSPRNQPVSQGDIEY